MSSGEEVLRNRLKEKRQKQSWSRDDDLTQRKIRLRQNVRIKICLPLGIQNSWVSNKLNRGKTNACIVILQDFVRTQHPVFLCLAGALEQKKVLSSTAVPKRGIPVHRLRRQRNDPESFERDYLITPRPTLTRKRGYLYPRFSVPLSSSVVSVQKFVFGTSGGQDLQEGLFSFTARD